MFTSTFNIVCHFHTNIDFKLIVANHVPFLVYSKLHIIFKVISISFHVCNSFCPSIKHITLICQHDKLPLVETWSPPRATEATNLQADKGDLSKLAATFQALPYFRTGLHAHIFQYWNLLYSLRSFNSLFATFADLHVRKVVTFANLHSYIHAYCSFVLLNEAITIVSGSHCAHALIWPFGFFIRFTGKKIQRVENSTSKIAPIPVRPKIMWHTGDLYVANKELKTLFNIVNAQF